MASGDLCFFTLRHIIHRHQNEVAQTTSLNGLNGAIFQEPESTLDLVSDECPQCQNKLGPTTKFILWPQQPRRPREADDCSLNDLNLRQRRRRLQVSGH